MPRVVTDGFVKIGAYKIPERKKPCLCVEKGNQLTVYGTFSNVAAAENFMNELGRFIGAKEMKEG